MNKVVLGKGLNALLSNEHTESLVKRKYKMVPIDSLQPNPMQPRKSFDVESIMELSESIKENGIIQPLIVQQSGLSYVIIAGERRYRASKLANLNEVPVLVTDDTSDLKKLELALVENIQRENLNIIETAEGYASLVEQFGYTQQQLSDRIGKSRTTIANQLRLLKLPHKVKEMVRSGKLTEGHARALLSLGDEEEQLKFAEKIANESMSVRVVEEQIYKPKKRRLVPKLKNLEITEAESKLKQIMGTSVKIVPGLKRSRIEIEYYGVEDLNRLLELFGTIN